MREATTKQNPSQSYYNAHEGSFNVDGEEKGPIMGKRKKRRFSFMDMMPTVTGVLLYKYYFARGELDKCPPLFTKEQNKLIEAVQKKLEKLKKREEAIAKIAFGDRRVPKEK